MKAFFAVVMAACCCSVTSTSPSHMPTFGTLAPSTALPFEVKIEARDGNFRDQFGGTTAIKGDVALVGTTRTQEQKPVSVFRNVGSTWLEVQNLTYPAKFDRDGFGEAMAMSGNLIVVGAPRADRDLGTPIYYYNSDESTGLAFVYFENPLTSSFDLVAQLAGSSDDLITDFGQSVAIDGNIIVVGGFKSLFVFRSLDGAMSWEQVAQFFDVVSVGPNFFFGRDVAISGNVIVSSAGESAIGARTEVKVFRSDDGGLSWAEVQTLSASDSLPDPNDFTNGFGSAVAISGPTVVVGAPSDTDNGDPNAGAAYVFRLVNGTWTEVQKLLASDGQTRDGFGTSVAIQGNVIVVGAWLWEESGIPDAYGYALQPEDPDQGAAYVFLDDGAGSWQEIAMLAASDKAPDDRFGRSVAIDNGRIIAGAPGARSTGGAAYIYSGVVGGA